MVSLLSSEAVWRGYLGRRWGSGCGVGVGTPSSLASLTSSLPPSPLLFSSSSPLLSSPLLSSPLLSSLPPSQRPLEPFCDSGERGWDAIHMG